MFRAQVNDHTFEIQTTGNGFIVDGKDVTWDMIRVSEGYFHLLLEHQSYVAEVVESDPASRSVVIRINNRLYPVQLKDKFDLLLEKMGMNANASGIVKSVKAPMPGLIIDLKVREGDAVKAGDALLILEAMKMENTIKSPGDGIVKSVKVKLGEGVEKNQVLIEF